MIFIYMTDCSADAVLHYVAVGMELSAIRNVHPHTRLNIYFKLNYEIVYHYYIITIYLNFKYVLSRVDRHTLLGMDELSYRAKGPKSIVDLAILVPRLNADADVFHTFLIFFR